MTVHLNKDGTLPLYQRFNALTKRLAPYNSPWLAHCPQRQKRLSTSLIVCFHTLLNTSKKRTSVVVPVRSEKIAHGFSKQL